MHALPNHDVQLMGHNLVPDMQSTLKIACAVTCGQATLLQPFRKPAAVAMRLPLPIDKLYSTAAQLASRTAKSLHLTTLNAELSNGLRLTVELPRGVKYSRARTVV